MSPVHPAIGESFPHRRWQVTTATPTAEFYQVAWRVMERIFTSYVDETLRCFDVATKRLERVSLVLPGGAVATFTGAGQLTHRDPAGLTDKLVYLVETASRRVLALTPPQFQAVVESRGERLHEFDKQTASVE